MMRVTDVITCNNQNNEKNSVNYFVAFSKTYKKKNNNQHLHPNKDILPIKTEWIPFINAVSSR